MKTVINDNRIKHSDRFDSFSNGTVDIEFKIACKEGGDNPDVQNTVFIDGFCIRIDRLCAKFRETVFSVKNVGRATFLAGFSRAKCFKNREKYNFKENHPKIDLKSGFQVSNRTDCLRQAGKKGCPFGQPKQIED